MSDILNTYIVDYRGTTYKVKAENLLDAWEVFKRTHKRYTNKSHYNYTHTIEENGFKYAIFFSTYFNDSCYVTDNINHKGWKDTFGQPKAKDEEEAKTSK